MHNDDIFLQSGQSPPLASRRDKGACPHWDASNRSCLLVEDGLFLPVEQHVATFCLSGYFLDCYQYQLLFGAGSDTDGEKVIPANRRRSIRVPHRHVFRFSEMTGSDQIPSIREDDAWTIDLSDHGIRFATRQFLAPETIIRFSLGFDTAGVRTEGAGKVVWSKDIENTQLFHSGITFTEQPDSNFHRTNILP